jgi:signal transduction histidine kinase
MTTAKAPDGSPAKGAHASSSQSGEQERAGAQRDEDTRVAARTAELSALITHLQNTAEAERSVLAKELHDELGGLITAAKMDMAWLTAHIGSTLDPASEEKFRSIVQMLNQAMTLKRRVVESLRPSLLDHFGLPVALRSHFDEHCSRAGVEYIATLPDETLDLTPGTQLALFRIAQEALASVLRRGSATHVELVIDADECGYTMLVGDDGAQLDAMLSQTLEAMRHRIQGSGGTLEAEQVPGQGNRIKVFVPRAASHAG